MSKKRKKKGPKVRSAQAYAARVLCTAETLPDRRTRRNRTRAAQKRRAIEEQQS